MQHNNHLRNASEANEQRWSEKYDKTPAQVALNWLVFQDSVIPIAGCKNAQQVEQNIGAIGWEMTQEEFNQLEQITRPWLN